MFYLMSPLSRKRTPSKFILQILTFEIMTPELKKTIISTLMELNPKEISIFGSYAKGEQRKNSDIDILIEYHEAPNFFEIVRAIRKLEDQIGIEVDLVDVDGVSQKFMDAVKLYASNIFSDVKRSA